MGRPRKYQELEGETMSEPKVRTLLAVVKTAPGSLTGDFTITEINELIETEFISKGYKLLTANAYHADQDAARVCYVFVKE